MLHGDRCLRMGLSSTGPVRVPTADLNALVFRGNM